MSELRSHLEEYLKLRRGLGYKLERAGQLCGLFVSYLDELGESRITTELAYAWACLPEGADSYWWAARYKAIRGFASYLATIDPSSEVPPADLLPGRSRRAEPYPYTEEDIRALMAAAASIPSPLRAATYETLIGLLWSTGLRVGEAIALDRDDVDLQAGCLLVRQAKFNQSREVPLHDSVSEALGDYAAARDRLCPSPRAKSFFVSLRGTRLIYNNVHFVFHRLIGQVGIAPKSARCRPRIHDLRHAYIMRAFLLADASRDDAPLYRAQVATIVGHVSPASTYWYLAGSRELLEKAATRLEESLGERP